MKSYKHLYETFISEENIRLAIIKASVGKLKRKSVKRIVNDIDHQVGVIHDLAVDFHNGKFKYKTVHDVGANKDRDIVVPPFKDQIIHHMVVQTMHEMLTKGMYKHTYASIPKRGLHKCMKAVKGTIQNPNHSKNIKYCAKLDIRKCFNSIDQELLKKRLAKHIHDERFLKILNEIVSATDRGLPLGFYTSQWLLNWMLQDLDHYIKEDLHVKYYFRYMDDMVLFGSNKRKLHKAVKSISEYLETNYHLQLKGNHQVFRFDYIKNDKHCGRALDFVGFKFYRDRVVLRKRLMMKLTRKAKKIEKKGKFTIHDAHQLASMFGWLDWADAYKVYSKYVASSVTFAKCKRYVSQYDKRRAKLEKEAHKKVLT